MFFVSGGTGGLVARADAESFPCSLFKNFTGSVTLDVVANKIQMFDYFLSKTNLRAKISILSILCSIPCAAGRT